MGTFRFSVKVTDASPSPRWTTTSYTLVIAPVSLLVASTALPAATVQNPYFASLETSGGTAPYTWKLLSGSLPGGITLSRAGNLAGVAAAEGTFKFSVQVRDGSPTSETATANLSLVVGGPINWSGYLEEGSYTSVTGTFTIPTSISCAQGQRAPAVVSQWVGIGGAKALQGISGAGGSALIEAGVTETWKGGGAQPPTCPLPNTTGFTISPWLQVVPGQPTPIVMTVQGGDRVTVTIFRISDGKWAVTLDDVPSLPSASRQDFRIEETYNGRATGVGYAVGASGTTPLAAYSPTVEFTNLQTVGPTHLIASEVLVQNHLQVSTPSAYSTRSASFSVAYGSVAPSGPDSTGGSPS